MKINIGGLLPTSIVNGDGIRTVIFSTGCEHGCDGCHNRHLATANSGESMSIRDIFNKIETNSKVTKKRVTFSGGDPFYQAEGFYELATLLKENGYNIWCYSGYTLKQIQDSGDINKTNLLQKIDVLVDGKFEKDMIGGALNYTGSANQKIIHMNKINRTSFK